MPQFPGAAASPPLISGVSPLEASAEPSPPGYLVAGFPDSLEAFFGFAMRALAILL